MFNDTMTESSDFFAKDDFRRLHRSSVLASVGALLTGRTNQLHNLAEVTQRRSVRSRYTLGRNTVGIEWISGSENRCDDFDASFRPRKSHLSERWSRMLIARQLGVSMPPIDLIQIDDTYFVRDGHHRISTAKQLGQLEIEAEVTVWHCDEVTEAPLRVLGNRWKRPLAPNLS
jgi:hypothetical protein